MTCATYNKRFSQLYTTGYQHICQRGDNKSSSDPSPSDLSLSDPSSRNFVCVAMTHLSHMPLSDLIFGTRRRAFVFCDGFDSFATPGHIVVYNDRPLMMRIFCSQYATKRCSKRVTVVNSPRMRGQLHIPSFPSELHFTALPANCETSFEEPVLGVLV